MNESVAFGFIMLNLLSYNRQSNLEKILNSENEIKVNKQKNEELATNFIIFLWINIIYGLAAVFIVIKFPNAINHLILIQVLFVFLLLCYIFLFIQIIYFSILEKKDLRIIRFIVNFQKKNNYPYLRNDFEQGRKVLERLDNKLIILKYDRMKDRETILFFKKTFRQKTLIEIKSYFCFAQEKYLRSISVDSEFLAAFFISILFLYIISLNTNLQEKLEETYNVLFGSSIFIFLGQPTMKWLLHRTTNHSIEIYTKCISLLDRAIN